MKRLPLILAAFVLGKAASVQQSRHVTEQEPNDDVAHATAATRSDTLFGTITSVTDVDYFAFDVPAGTMLRMARTANDENACLIDRDGVTVLGCFRTTVATGYFNYPVIFAGRYYMRFSSSQPSAGDIVTGDYGVAMSAESFALGPGDPTTIIGSLGDPHAQHRIATGYQGELYILSLTDTGRIDRLSRSGAVAGFATVPGASNGIAMDVFGNLLVAVRDGEEEAIRSVTPNGNVTTFASHLGKHYPDEGLTIAVGPDGDVWTGQVDTIWRLSPTGVLKSKIPVPLCDYHALAVSPDGVLYFTAFASGCRGVSIVTPAGGRQFVVRDTVGDLAFDRDGKLYIAAWDGYGGNYADYPDYAYGHVLVFDPQNQTFARVAEVPILSGLRFLRDASGQMTSRLVAAPDWGVNYIRELNGASGRAPGFGPPRATQTTTIALRSGTLGAAYADTLEIASATGSLTWSVTSGNLPPGIRLTSDGRVSGTPSDTGAFAIGVKAVGASTTWSGQATIKVAPVTILIGAIVDALLGGTPLHPALADFLDRHGNRNQKLDIGDLRAHLNAQPKSTIAAAPPP